MSDTQLHQMVVLSRLRNLTAFGLSVSIARLTVVAMALTFASWAGQQRPALAEQAGNSLQIVVLGDSLVAGYGLGPGEAFPERLQAALRERGHEISIVNAGVSGDTTTGGLARLDWSVPDGTDGVILELGANDALRGLSPEATRANLNSMIERLKQRGIQILLAGMLAPPNMGAAYEAEFNAIYPDLASRHAIELYPFFLDGVAAEPELNQDDGIHPTAEGIAVIVDKFMPHAERFVVGMQSGVAAEPALAAGNDK